MSNTLSLHDALPIWFSVAELFDHLADYGRSVAGNQPHVTFEQERTLNAGFQAESDEQRIYQIVTNLIDNAFRHTDRGHVRLILSCEQHGTDLLHLKIAVSDTGRGVSLVDQRRIFKPFRQVGQQATGHNGLGLGLALGQQYAQQLGGILSVTSDEGRGSCFTLDIPTLRRLADLVSTTDSKPRFIGRVLLVEDEQANLIVLQSQLEELGLNVTPATSVAQAKLLWKEGDIDLLVADQYLEDGSCWDLLPQVRRYQLPMVVVSAAELSYPGDLKAAEYVGTSIDYLPKPIWGKSLRQVLAKYLPQKSAINIPETARRELSNLLAQNQLLEIEALARRWMEIAELELAGQMLLECCEAMDTAKMRALLLNS